MQGVWIPSLVGELRSHMLHGAAKKWEKKKQQWEVEPISLRTLICARLSLGVSKWNKIFWLMVELAINTQTYVYFL